MTRTGRYFAAALTGAALFAAPLQAQPVEEAITFEAGNGESVAAFQGSFEVPENRADPNSRMIEIGYVRFPATTETPGDPIVYLAGGPGGSGTGTARERRFPLFMQMRRHADVIAYDQRGTGLSANAPRCESSVGLPDLEPVTDAEAAQLYQQAVIECAAFWASEGVDLRGYTTAESAADLSDLRRHLGAEQIDLWGISYGSHLAFAALNSMPDEIGKVIVASAEGLDQTVKYPARSDEYVRRIQAAVNTQPAAAALYPDIEGMIRRVQARLEEEPMLVEYPQRDGSMAQILIQRRHGQEMVSRMSSDPQFAAVMLAVYAALDQGDTSVLQGVLPFFYTPGSTIRLSAMSTAMDRASGISAERLAEVERQIPTAMVGGYLNFPMPQILPVLTELDLGPEFRRGPFGDTPTLLLSGTLDGRTYPDSQREAVAGMSDVTWIIVENAGHNLFMSSPEVHEAMHAFMEDRPVGNDRIIVEAPDFTQMPF